MNCCHRSWNCASTQRIQVSATWLIELFERELIESQEVLGASVIGEFRDLDNPDLFFWLRVSRDIPARAQALTEFYGGPIWKAHRDATNARMADSDNVLLLRPARSNSAFQLPASGRPQRRRDYGATAALESRPSLSARAAVTMVLSIGSSSVLQPAGSGCGRHHAGFFHHRVEPEQFSAAPGARGREALSYGLPVLRISMLISITSRHCQQSPAWRELSTQLAVRLHYLPGSAPIGASGTVIICAAARTRNPLPGPLASVEVIQSGGCATIRRVATSMELGWPINNNNQREPGHCSVSE